MNPHSLQKEKQESQTQALWYDIDILSSVVVIHLLIHKTFAQ